VTKLCAQFPGEYWRKLRREMKYPKEFVDALTEAGYLSVLIPEEYDGAGLKLSAAAAILEEIQRAGCNGGGCHAQMYTMGHAAAAWQRRAEGEMAAEDRERRIAAAGVRPSPSRPAAPIPPSLKTFARRDGKQRLYRQRPKKSGPAAPNIPT